MKYISKYEKRSHGTFAFPVGYYHLDHRHPRYVMVEHWHPEFELIRINRGMLRLSSGGQSYLGRAGDLFVIAGGTIHSGIPERCEYECAVFKPEAVLACCQSVQTLLEEVLEGRQKIEAHIQPAGRLKADAEHLFSALQSKQPQAPLFAVSAVYAIFGQLLSDHTYAIADKVRYGNDRRSERIKEVLRFIRMHYQDDITLEEMARCAHMNKQYFCTYFKEMTGKTPVQYINHYRVECACEQLLHTELNISQIALDCGFANISYFNKVFRSWKHTTPGEYRRDGTSAEICAEEISRRPEYPPAGAALCHLSAGARFSAAPLEQGRTVGGVSAPYRILARQCLRGAVETVVDIAFSYSTRY